MAEAISSWIDATTKIGDALIDWAKPAGRGDSPLKVFYILLTGFAHKS